MFKIDAFNKIVIEPELLTIPSFEEIWNKDNSQDKTEAYKIFKFIYFMCDYKSPYNNYGLDKEKTIIRDFFGDIPVVKIPELEAAMNKYNELKKIPEVHLLEAAREGMFKMSDFLKKTELNGGNYLTYAKAMDTVAKVQQNYSSQKENVEREMGKQGKSRGDRKRGNREM